MKLGTKLLVLFSLFVFKLDFIYFVVCNDKNVVYPFETFLFSPGRPSMDILVKFLPNIVTRYCQELQDAMVRSYQESHVSKKNFTKKRNTARKI